MQRKQWSTESAMGKASTALQYEESVLELTLDFRLHNLCLFQVIAQALLDSLTMFYGTFYIVAGYLFWFRNSHSFPCSVSSFRVVRFAPPPLDFHFILCSPFWSSYFLLQIVASRIWSYSEALMTISMDCERHTHAVVRTSEGK